ncbi:hypothetical protein [Photobacterium leiognathi]|uniref:hypothetical protein n=1 Tax=Photobacterium leiognathi TaxID=553611 RepID=UPI00298197C1|nr:hypothetical protein [Photobacterium leiognathi]
MTQLPNQEFMLSMESGFEVIAVFAKVNSQSNLEAFQTPLISPSSLLKSQILYHGE